MNQNKTEFNRNWSLSDDLSEVKFVFKLPNCRLETTLTSDIIFFPKKLKGVPFKTEGEQLDSLQKNLEELRESYNLSYYDLNVIDNQCYCVWLDIIDGILEEITPTETKLYIMQNQDGLIKIGKSKDPNRRRKALQYQLGDSIEILKVLHYHKYEKDIHRVFEPFNAYYSGGIEWFTPYPELVKWIDSVDDENFEKLYKKLCQKNLNTQKKK